MRRAAGAPLVLLLAFLAVGTILPGVTSGQAPDPVPQADDGGPVPRLRISPGCADTADAPATPTPTRPPITITRPPLTHVVPLATPTPTPTFYIGSEGFAPVLAKPAELDRRVFDAPSSLDIRVRGSGFEPRSDVVLAFGRSLRAVQTFPGIRADQLGTFDVSVTVRRPVARGRYQVVATTPSDRIPLAVAELQLPCDTGVRPSVEVETQCPSGAGGSGRPSSLRVSGRDFEGLGSTVRLTLVPLAGGARVDLGEARIRRDGTFLFEAPRAGRLEGETFELIALSADGKPVARVVFDVTCVLPTVEIAPDCGPGGRPTTRLDIEVRAAGFTPGADVLVLWDGPRSHEAWPARVNRRGRVNLTIRPLRRPAGEYAVRVLQQAALPVGTATDFGTPDVSTRAARTTFVAPCPVLEETGTLAVGPRCSRPVLQGDEPRQIRYRVQGEGFRAGPVEVRFDEGGTDEERFEATADASGAFLLDIRSEVRAVPVVRIVALQSGTVEGSAATFTVTAQTRFRTPCEEAEPPPLVLAPACSAPAEGVEDAYAIEIRGSGFYSDGLVFLSLDGETPEQRVRADAGGSFVHIYRAVGRPPGEYAIRGVQRAAATGRGEVAAAEGRFTVPCDLEPVILIVPPMGPAGYTAHVSGRDFPPGAEAVLTWDRGMDAGREIIVPVDAGGSFSVYLYILPNDLAGERTLSAIVAGQAGLYPEATSQYLVVPGTGSPPTLGDDGIIYRR